MRQLNEKLDELRRSLGYTYEQVQGKLEARDVHITAAAVGHWFNGTRKPRSMKHLQALCAVLESTLAAVVGDEIEIAESAKEQLILKQFRGMSPEQQGAFLALASTLTVRAYPPPEEQSMRPHAVHESKQGDQK